MQFISEYGLFFLKTLTLVAAILFTVLGCVIIGSRGKEDNKLSVKKLNKKFKSFNQQICAVTHDKKTFKLIARLEKKEQKHKQSDTRRKVYVLNFHGDIKASAVENLRQEVSSILTVAKPEDEVVLNLESSGGMVHAYGLAASQLQRFRANKIPLTVCIDKIAASGGYLMACVADKILAAPFAIVGSIGVVAQIPNFHRLLKKNNIDFELITAGEYKRTLTLFGENTDKGRKKFLEDVEEIHDIFKSYLSENRPQLDIEKVATGEHWPGTKAFELKLIDSLITSDDYLMQTCNEAEVFEISYKRKKNLTSRLSESITSLISNIVSTHNGVI